MPDHPTPTETGTRADFQLSQEPITPSADAPPHPAAPAYEYLGELPTDYGTTSVYLVAYDPHQLFAYWDLDATTLATVAAPLTLRVCRAENGEVESQVDLGRAVGLSGAAVMSGGNLGRYLPVIRSGTEYYVELGTGGGATGVPWRALAVSGRVTVPPEGIAAVENGDARFATLPFHLSFQRLSDLLRAAVPAAGHGQSLTESLAGLPHDPTGWPADAALVEALGRLNEEQRRRLQVVLDQQQEPGFAPSSATASFAGDSPTGGGLGGGSEGLSSRSYPAGVSSAGMAGGSEALSSLGGAGALSSAAGPTSGGFAPSSAAASFAARAAGGSEVAGRPSSAAYAASLGGGVSSAAFLGPRGAGASGAGASALFGPGPSSEAWRRAAAGGAVAGSGGGSDQFARERAERFLRAVTSSLDVLGALFSATGAGASGGSVVGGSSGNVGSSGSPGN